jgi:farnesyl-diphosphate farnesyltransferase
MAGALRRTDGRVDCEALNIAFRDFRNDLPAVTIAFAGIADAVPEPVRQWVWPATAEMAEDMASWALRGWSIHTEQDLDDYTYAVAGRVGVMLSDLWKWFDGTQTGKADAIAFGRGLQAVNIVRKDAEDREREVSFFPDGWTRPQMIAYARHNLAGADRYMTCLPPGPIHDFCDIPLRLAKATLDAIESGRAKLSLQEVLRIAGPGCDHGRSGDRSDTTSA